MPTETFTWEWEEAFQTYGFGDGLDPTHNEDVASVLEENGWKCIRCYCSHNDGYLCELSKGGVKVEISGDEETADLRKLLPAEIVALLDKEFTDDD
jgi:hypothetical protein